jgi:Methyltransferase domain
MRARMSDSSEPLVRALADGSTGRLDLWSAFLDRVDARTVAEIGVFRGEFAEHVLDACPRIETYYMLDPWRHLDDWNKPANRDDAEFEEILAEAMERTRAHAGKRVVLRGRTTDVVDEIPDGSLDFAYVDGDHTLRGITIDLVRVYPKVRAGGWIGGDDFARSIWQHGPEFEPTLVFPFAVHFAEAVGAPIHGLPHGQFLIEKRRGFEFVDHTGKYARRELLRHVLPRRPR